MQEPGGAEKVAGAEQDVFPLTGGGTGIGVAFWKTFQECVRHPLDIFSRSGFDAGMSRFFLYAFSLRFGAAILALEVRWMVADIPMDVVVLAGAMVDVLLELLLLPVIVFVGLRTIGTKGIRFRETFNILALIRTAAILIPVPLIGWQIYTILIFVWSIPALTRGHGIALWRSVVAVLFPLLLITGVLLVVLFVNGMQ